MNSIKNQIQKMGFEMCSPYNDGFTTFEIKKKLYEIKWEVDRFLEKAPTYVGEEEWLEEKSINKNVTQR